MNEPQIHDMRDGHGLPEDDRPVAGPDTHEDGVLAGLGRMGARATVLAGFGLGMIGALGLPITPTSSHSISKA
jgi:hypothetical protein